MKLNIPILDEPLDLMDMTLFVIEDVTVYANLVKEFYQYSEATSLQLFEAKHRVIKPTEMMIVTDILGYNINTPTILKMIYTDLEQQLNEKPEVKSMIDKLAATITELIAYECLENELDLEYDEITILELIKALGVQVETTSDTLFEKMFEILQIYKYLSKKKLLVFINSLSYFTKDEIDKIMEYIALSNMKVLFLEPRKVKGFKQYVLDDDYFLMVENVI